MEPWEKVLVDGENFPLTAHGQKSCTECHNGNSSEEKETAHLGMIPNPSQDSQTICGQCHEKEVALEPHSLHNNLAGYWSVLEDRGAPVDHPKMTEMFGNHCSSCHATCGECHVSQPKPVGGGLLEGHLFVETPSMTRNCTACHGSRIGNEYLGKHEDLLADVHFRQGRMRCVDCHTAQEIHGDPGNCQECHEGPETAGLEPPVHRYDGAQMPRCETCHIQIAVGQDDNQMHQQHSGELACQVCHSVAYTSCDGCHVSVSENSGRPIFATEGSYLTFYIGKNPIKSWDRPYDYVLVRHVPVSEDSFAYYGEDLLKNFDNESTWKYTTPHNIQRQTPQTQSCDSCHGNEDVFLTADKIAPFELDANKGVVIEKIPPSVIELFKNP